MWSVLKDRWPDQGEPSINTCPLISITIGSSLDNGKFSKAMHGNISQHIVLEWFSFQTCNARSNLGTVVFSDGFADNQPLPRLVFNGFQPSVQHAIVTTYGWCQNCDTIIVICAGVQLLPIDFCWNQVASWPKQKSSCKSSKIKLSCIGSPVPYLWLIGHGQHLDYYHEKINWKGTQPSTSFEKEQEKTLGRGLRGRTKLWQYYW